MNYAQRLATEFSLQEWQISNTIKLLDEGNTIPFIARYRKEAHGTLDDQILREVADRLTYLRNLEARRTEIYTQIQSQGNLTQEIESALSSAETLSEIEDIYRPFRPKRKTRASIAKEKGLQPLADKIYLQEKDCVDPFILAEDFITDDVPTKEDAIKGAMDIIAEAISDNASIRKRLRVVAMANAILQTKAIKEDAESVYEAYYEFSEPVSKIAGHRILAIDRGEREGFLKVSINLEESKGLFIIDSTCVILGSSCTDIVREAGHDAYARLIFPSIEREIRSSLTEKSAEQAIKVFALNLSHLLMQPPVKGKIVLGLDPGYRTGCKVAVIDNTGLVLDTAIIYPIPEFKRVEQAKTTIKNLITTHGVNVIAIGNGTASKETEIFAAEVISEMNCDVAYMIVSEAGASVYSASKIAAEEFPDFDLTLRSAVSIARRIQDPLAELVKIDPKAIGVGQYQHDMPKKRLDDALGGVVENCVNSVGVDLNTASPSLLSHIAGISGTVSKNIVKYREENGAFKSRAELKKVPKLGPKAFEQCAGFLRVSESKNVLDNTSVHPESYDCAKKVLEICSYSIADLKKGNISELEKRIDEIGKDKVAQFAQIGLPTLEDIIKELLRPGRDPRDELPAPLLRTDVMDISDLKDGMIFSGTVRNVIDFGAFVDIGVHQDGLVHISEICNRFIKHPSEAVKIGDIVDVMILSVDVKKKRISLTMKIPNKQISK